VANAPDIGPRQIRILVESAYADEPVICKCSEKAFARLTKSVGAAGPIGHKPIHEPKALPHSFSLEGFEIGGKRGQACDLNSIGHIYCGGST
jgi:hypothetical protein